MPGFQALPPTIRWSAFACGAACLVFSCETDTVIGAFSSDDVGSGGGSIAGRDETSSGGLGGRSTQEDGASCSAECSFPSHSCVDGGCVRVLPTRAFAVGNAAICLESAVGPECSGQNLSGELGSGETLDRRAEFRSVAGEAQLHRVVGAPGDHFMAHDQVGSAWAWGNNYAGGLGLGDVEQRGVPTLISDLTPWSSLAPGSGHSCFLTPVGGLSCSGRNVDGELGVGDRVDRLVATEVPGEWAQVSVGWGHSCALNPAGELYCWGLNDLGQLGVGDTLSREIPALVDTGPFHFISAEVKRSCAIRADGELLCWGDNQLGQAGVGGREPVLVPQPVVGEQRWTMVAGGFFGVCGVTTAKELYCWGKPPDDATNDPSDRDQLTPSRIGTLSDWSWVRRGFGTACALKVDESLWCWGRNNAGQLGLGDEVPREFPTITGP